MLIERGHLFFVFLDPVFGKEIGGYKTRPVVVISINDISAKQLPVLVVPGTSADGKPAHFKNVVRVEPTRDNGLKNPDPTGLQVLKKCRVSSRRHFCHPTSFQGRGCENGRSTEDPAIGS